MTDRVQDGQSRERMWREGGNKEEREEEEVVGDLVEVYPPPKATNSARLRLALVAADKSPARLSAFAKPTLSGVQRARWWCSVGCCGAGTCQRLAPTESIGRTQQQSTDGALAATDGPAHS
jgi:hypothetical protein